MFVAEPHHIIAIGASDGGLEEINTFFDHTPVDGVSYVIVQHLSTEFKSRMVELLFPDIVSWSSNDEQYVTY